MPQVGEALMEAKLAPLRCCCGWMKVVKTDHANAGEFCAGGARSTTPSSMAWNEAVHASNVKVDSLATQLTIESDGVCAGNKIINAEWGGDVLRTVKSKSTARGGKVFGTWAVGEGEKPPPMPIEE